MYILCSTYCKVIAVSTLQHLSALNPALSCLHLVLTLGSAIEGWLSITRADRPLRPSSPRRSPTTAAPPTSITVRRTHSSTSSNGTRSSRAATDTSSMSRSILARCRLWRPSSTSSSPSKNSPSLSCRQTPLPPALQVPSWERICDPIPSPTNSTPLSRRPFLLCHTCGGL